MLHLCRAALIPGVLKSLTNVSSSAGPVPLNVYQRLKKLEDRILELEGLSPEYFQSTVSFVAIILKMHTVNLRFVCSLWRDLNS